MRRRVRATSLLPVLHFEDHRTESLPFSFRRPLFFVWAAWLLARRVDPPTDAMRSRPKQERPAVSPHSPAVATRRDPPAKGKHAHAGLTGHRTKSGERLRAK
nr:hypothetical protein [Pandoravirus belohorizontensis]